MQSILEQIQTRIAEAEKRVNEAGKLLHAADKAYNAAVSEFHVWRSALEAETRAQQEATNTQTVFAGMESLVSETANSPKPPVEDPDATIVNATAPVQPSGTNKTEMIRELLRQNPAGLTPPQIWQQVTKQFKHRPYLYSVLKRLKDQDEVVIRRHKYVLRQDQEVAQSLMVQ